MAARIASGTLLTLRMMSLYDLSTVTNIFASAGSCLWISGALKILSRYSQLRWHVSHWSYNSEYLPLKMRVAKAVVRPVIGRRGETGRRATPFRWQISGVPAAITSITSQAKWQSYCDWRQHKTIVTLVKPDMVTRVSFIYKYTNMVYSRRTQNIAHTAVSISENACC